MTATVYYAGMNTRKHEDSKIAKVARLCDAVGLAGMVGENALTAIKMHFGEYGNDTFLSPVLVRQVVDKVEAAGGKAFLTDTNTLYSGSRHNAVDHLHTAYLHGFVPSVVRAPVIIADGISGKNDEPVKVNLKHFDEVHIAQEILEADAMVVLSHFKGHQAAGFGGAIKNLAMGCAAPRGKREQHDDKVAIAPELCIACGRCVKICPQQAISLKKDDETAKPKAVADKKKCIGCFECMTVCEQSAISPVNDLSTFTEKLAEYAYGAVKDKAGKVCYINFVMNITPDCDCAAWSDMPIVPDLGILASTDPVALDKACFDLVKKAASLVPMKNNGVGEDKFSARWPDTFGSRQFSHGEAIGLGTTEYELKEI